MNPPSINSVDHGFGFQWIHAVGVMNLGPVQGRVEHTGHDHLGLGTQDVRVVLIEDVDGARRDRVDPAVGDGQVVEFKQQFIYNYSHAATIH